MCTRIEINVLASTAVTVCFSNLVGVTFFRLHESPEEEPHILLECDGGVLDAIQKHLKLYKIRRKVNIAPCLDLSLWAVIPGEQAGDIASSLAKCADQAPILSPDPRTEVMGWRVITKKGVNLSEIIPGSHVGNIQDYHRHRYKQGKAKIYFALDLGIFFFHVLSQFHIIRVQMLI